MFVECINNGDGYYLVDLTIGKKYEVLPIKDSERDHGLIRIIDNSGEDYIYPEKYFKKEEIMFERLTESAKRIKDLAQEEARNLETNYLGTEHLLLAVLKEGSMNRFIPFTHKEALDAVIDILGIKSRKGNDESILYPITPRSKKIFELALSEAIQMKNNYIGVNHILLGLLRENEGVAAKVFENLEIDKEELIKNIKESTPEITNFSIRSFSLKPPSISDDEVKIRRLSVSEHELYNIIEELVKEGTTKFNITILDLPLIDGKRYFNITTEHKRKDLVNKAKKIFPMLDIK